MIRERIFSEMIRVSAQKSELQAKVGVTVAVESKSILIQKN